MGYESKLSDIIASLPEISGGFLYSPDHGVYSNQAEAIGDNPTLQNVCLKLIKISSMVSVQFRDTGAIRIIFKDLVLFGTLIEQDHWLFLFHQPSLGPGMIRMTVQMALNISPEGEMETSPDASYEESTSAEGGAGYTTTMEDLLDNHPELSNPLNEIKEKLASHIGPVAELVMDDFVDTWTNKTDPTPENLPDLILSLCEEIDEEGERNEFKDSLKSFF